MQSNNSSNSENVRFHSSRVISPRKGDQIVTTVFSVRNEDGSLSSYVHSSSAQDLWTKLKDDATEIPSVRTSEQQATPSRLSSRRAA